MRIKSCTDFINEANWLKKLLVKEEPDPADNENDVDGNGVPDFLYHAVEIEAVDSIMRDGLNGEIYLTETPEEAAIHHPIVLKIDTRYRDVRRARGHWVVKNVPIDQIERMDL